MAKVSITFDFESIEELGEVLSDIGGSDSNGLVTDIWIDLKEEEAQVLPDEDRSWEAFDRSWKVVDQSGEVVKYVTTEEVMKGDW